MALPAGRYGVTKNQLLKIKKLPMNTIKLIEELTEKFDLLGTSAFKNSTSVVTDSSDLVESGAVYTALQGKADMAIGNIVGSNIFNTLMILGITALVAPMAITKNNLKRDIPLNIVVTVLLIILGMNLTLFGKGQDQISRLDGAILLAVFAWYLWTSFKSDQGDASEEGEGIKEYKTGLSVIMIAAGLAGLIFGGRLFVNSATELAKMFGVSDKFIAITVMAAGTSMPELATCVVAALKGRGQLALGNVLGSNISNILFILGGASLIAPLSFNGMTPEDLGLVLISAIIIFASAFMFKKREIDRYEGVIFLLLEIGYMWYLIANL